VPLPVEHSYSDDAPSQGRHISDRRFGRHIPGDLTTQQGIMGSNTVEGLDEDTQKGREALTVGQYGGIYPLYEAFYIHSVIYAAERSESAFQRFEVAVTEVQSAALTVATIQEGLTHAGALSRFFWPMSKNSSLATARGKRLRDAFGLDDKSPLRWRQLRNAFEHFDEDLDRFLLRDRVGYLFPGPLVDDHRLADEAIGNIFKLVDPQHGVCVLLGEKFEFRPIRHEVQRVLALALEMDKQGSRL